MSIYMEAYAQKSRKNHPLKNLIFVPYVIFAEGLDILSDWDNCASCMCQKLKVLAVKVHLLLGLRNLNFHFKGAKEGVVSLHTKFGDTRFIDSEI